jgi:hypothetical protein
MIYLSFTARIQVLRASTTRTCAIYQLVSAWMPSHLAKLYPAHFGNCPEQAKTEQF